MQIRVRHGDDSVVQLTIQDDVGSAVDVTGGLVTVDIRSVNRSVVLSVNSRDPRLVVTDAAQGALSLSLGHGDTDDLLPGDYQLDVAVEDADGNRYTATTDILTVLPV